MGAAGLVICVERRNLFLAFVNLNSSYSLFHLILVLISCLSAILRALSILGDVSLKILSLNYLLGDLKEFSTEESSFYIVAVIYGSILLKVTSLSWLFITTWPFGSIWTSICDLGSSSKPAGRKLTYMVLWLSAGSATPILLPAFLLLSGDSSFFDL